MEEPVTTQQVQSAPRPDGRSRIILIGLLVIVLALIAVAAFVPIQGFTLYERVRASAELRGLHIGERSYQQVRPSAFGIFGLRERSLDGVAGTLGDYAVGGATEAGIVTASDGRMNVWVLGSSARQLTDTAAYKASLAVSPDGKYVAYAARAGGENSYAPTFESWAMHIVDLELGTDVELGFGFEPNFFTRDGVNYLLFTTAEGIQVTMPADAGSYRSFTTPFAPTNLVEYAAKVSADGMYLAHRDQATKRFNVLKVYRVAADLPLGLDPVGQLGMISSDVAFLSNHVLTIDNGSRDTGTVWKIDLSDLTNARKFYTYPTELPSRFIQ